MAKIDEGGAMPRAPRTPEEWANKVLGLPNGPEYPNREIHACIAAGVRAALAARASADQELANLLLKAADVIWGLARLGAPDLHALVDCLDSARASLAGQSVAPRSPPWPNDRCPTHGSFMCANCLGVPYMPGARGGNGSLAMILAAKAAYRRACEAAEPARSASGRPPDNEIAAQVRRDNGED